ncbi:GntR family transcriptional regulator [Mesorhizobium sp. M4B.F.Ca.ET.215.01.1.1]|uniref:GntR family transcriptional regulator n=1 Tax=Mesorhizobium TaxID=68287 RepID=UPI000FCBE81F|nr:MULTISPECIES: GntR family transcriptional regulator [Mesorhizobium]MDX8431952.1 GntR family transcriptional regulator [Mesorhizobium abyssinicae]RUW24075.1 GntR family transcriptional regulator [Mesorhizobium sp. M4B.F.Ca.ET.013.02.1.1]RVD43877.1 GntR family transcriptional regulator [Mesorhizobium sp. M4B.F.Ca.ET.019.03.1.1]RWC95711.1 MAG: GntR family transcriptional regulator [Mesorhizobium sp.]RWF29254.1 MAG: GntR family transcriptional regulator [Mesorhizobium sp.]
MTYGTADPGDEGAGPKSTLASTVYHQLRDDLLRGVLETESKLRVEWVVSRYGAGASPVREALNRLASEGLLGRHDQRGFFLMPVSAEELDELTRTRCWLEERALRESIEHRTGEWEEQLVLALHRLARAQRRLPGEPSTNNPDWEKLHRAFHRALIAGCRSHWLVGFCDQLSDQASRYRLISQHGPGDERDDLAEHRQIAERTLDGDADGAVEALLNHYRLTAAMCMARFSQDGDPKATAAKALRGRK